MSKIKCKGCGGDYYTSTEQCDTDGCNWTQYQRKCNHAYNDNTITDDGRETCIFCGEGRNE